MYSYSKLRYNVLHQRAQSSTCETLAAQTALALLEATALPSSMWIAKRDQYASVPMSLAYRLLDFMSRAGGSISADGLDTRHTALLIEWQRHWSALQASLRRAALEKTDDVRAAVLLTALNAGAWLDAFLWRDAHRESGAIHEEFF